MCHTENTNEDFELRIWDLELNAEVPLQFEEALQYFCIKVPFRGFRGCLLLRQRPGRSSA
jgi:hypothetical protein